MATVQEIEMRMAEALPKLKSIARYVEGMTNDLLNYGTHFAIGREVCARRARKLRKRGESVRYVGRTSTGKARYIWMRRIAPWAIYMPNV